jgi:DNA-binding PucR family transcriptional regulator
MFVHPNTFRYRLRRAAEVGRIDLNDRSARLSAMLQLHLMALRDAPGR